jgi:hypothetical protein
MAESLSLFKRLSKRFADSLRKETAKEHRFI